ncbi:9614_t:CDS:2, partial [Cetraspora pellucida]
LQIQNSNKNIILGSANLLNSPKPITTMQSTHSKYGSYINDHTARQFVLAIAHIIEESLMIDKSNTISNKKNLTIVSQHISCNLPVFHYLGIIKLQSTLSNTIFNDLEQFILAKHLPHEALYHFGSNGASIN